MIKPESDKTDRLKSDSTIEAIKKIVETRDKSLISESIYRDPYLDKDEIRSKVEDQLAKFYLYKCAYCERLEKADIEHYRPKKSVKDETHEGYFWLCYEWTNLLPSCVKCNRDGAKLTHFPIMGTRFSLPIYTDLNQFNFGENNASRSPLIDEKPMLLHPEIDKPEKFFEFEMDSGGEGIRIKGIDPEGRGSKTIEICKLNRQELRLGRQSDVIDPFVEAVEAVFSLLEKRECNEESFIAQLRANMETLKRNSSLEKKTHTLLRKFIVQDKEQFKTIVIPYFLPKTHEILLAAFDDTFN